MKKSKLPRELTKNASKLHRHVGELLQNIREFNGYEIRQEYPVKKVNSEHSSGREKFDWVILGARIIIECHGEQHYKPTQFGGISKEEAKRNLVKQQERDENKRRAAQEAGWTYVVVSHEEADINESELSEKVKETLAASLISRVTDNMWKKVKEAAENNSKPLKTKKRKYKWPKRKIPSRPLNQKE